MTKTYINEPLVQKLPLFTSFMGGLGFLGSLQKLSKLTAQPRHWRGTRIPVKTFYPTKRLLAVTIHEDGALVYCNHADQQIEQVSFNDGLDTEFIRPLAICQKCGAGWDEYGEQLLNSNIK